MAGSNNRSNARTCPESAQIAANTREAAETKQRVEKLENWQSWVKGVLAAMGVVLGIALALLTISVNILLRLIPK